MTNPIGTPRQHYESWKPLPMENPIDLSFLALQAIIGLAYGWKSKILKSDKIAALIAE